jgi:hypothetical protein
MHRTSRNLALETRRSTMILALSGLGVAASAAALPWLRKPARDSKTACLTGPPARKTIILIDRTDAWTASTATLLAGRLKRIVDEAETEERLLMVPFDGSATALPAPVFDRCKPPSSANIVTETPQRVAKFHTEQFAAPLLRALDGLASPSSAKRTELVQMLALLAAHARLNAPAGTTAIHVFSDMEENSAAFSFTRRPGQPPEQLSTHLASVFGERLTNIALHIHILPSAGNPARPNPRIEQAWRAALTAHSIRFTWGVL